MTDLPQGDDYERVPDEVWRQFEQAEQQPPDTRPVVEQAAEHGLRYVADGSWVLRDGEQYLEGNPEALAGLADLLNEAVTHDRESRARVTARVRKDRLQMLDRVLQNPTTVIGPRMKTESAPHWAARAVMRLVDRWL